MAQIAPSLSVIVLDIQDRFPAEAALLGRLVLGYGDLEMELMECLRFVLRNDLDTPAKAMFRTRGETQRIAVADSIGRYRFHDLSLGTDFEMAVGNMHFCLKIRNQYAHCSWMPHKKHGLCFVNFESLANRHERLDIEVPLDLHAINEELLKKQEQYFRYVLDHMRWLKFEARARLDRRRRNHCAKPKHLERPALYTGGR